MPELVFKIVGFLLFVPYVQVRKAWRRKILAHLKEAPVLERKPVRERWLLGMLAVTTLPLFVWWLSPWLDVAALGLPAWVRFAGAGLIALGDWYFWRTHVALAENWTPVLEIREGHRLITSGPYRYVRHPMYASAFIINLGLGIVSSNWIVAATLFAGLTILYAVRVRDEEQLMIDTFGEEYRAYMRRTGRLFPRLSVLTGA